MKINVERPRIDSLIHRHVGQQTLVVVRKREHAAGGTLRHTENQCGAGHRNARHQAALDEHIGGYRWTEKNDQRAARYLTSEESCNFSPGQEQRSIRRNSDDKAVTYSFRYTAR